MKNVSAILTSDWHIRESAPVCRDESEYFAAQAKKIEFIKELQHRYVCPILIAGDVFDKWKPSPFLLGWFVEQFCNLVYENVYVIPGQHDLPQHNQLLYQKSGLHLLEVTDVIEVLEEGRHYHHGFRLHGFWYGSEPEFAPVVSDKMGELTNVALAHTFTWRGRKPWPDCTAPGAQTLLKKMEGFDLVVTGDNHQAFTMEYKGRLLVNPGSLMRMSADQADFKPRVYLWGAKANEVEPVFLPIEEGVVSRDHIERAQERDKRIESFVGRLQGEWQASLSFEENLNRFFGSNEVDETIKQLIYDAMEKNEDS